MPGLLQILTDPGDFKFYAGGKGYVSTPLQFGQKSIPYGKDRPGGGSSPQPFIQVSKKNSFDLPLERLGNEVGGVPAGPDYILRGGLLAPVRAFTDASRLFKLFTQGGYQISFDIDADPFGFNPSTPDRTVNVGLFGAMFTAKQNLLSRIGTDMDAGYPSLIRLLGSPLNQGIYTPLSTLGQALGGFAGLHLFKQGLNPLTGSPKYMTLVAPLGNDEIGIKLTQNVSAGVVISNNRLVNLYQNAITSKNANASGIGGSNGSATLFTYGGGPGSVLGIGRTTIKTTDVRTPFSGIGSKGAINWTTFSQKQISDYNVVGDGGSTLVQDFRKNLSDKPKSIISDSPNYTKKNIEQRVKLGDPGKRGVDRSNYTRGIVDDKNRPDPLDKINALYLYKSQAVTTDSRKNDLVKFRIATIDNDNPKLKTFTHFRAFINSFSDSMNASWNSFKYIGRGEDFYTYQGFTNSISMGFTVVAQSIQELSIMFQKLNYLKSTLAPDYSDNGYMRGNIHQLTLGGYFYETPGIIESLTYTIPEDTTWEIGIPASVAQSTEAAGSNGFTDSAVKELPHRIEVSLTFKPIFKFLPQTVKDINGATNIKQRFISLEDSDSSVNNNLYANGVSNVYRPKDHQIQVQD